MQDSVRKVRTMRVLGDSFRTTFCASGDVGRGSSVSFATRSTPPSAAVPAKLAGKVHFKLDLSFKVL